MSTRRKGGQRRGFANAEKALTKAREARERYGKLVGVLQSTQATRNAPIAANNVGPRTNTKTGITQFLNQNSLRSLSQVDSGFRNMVKHSFHFQPLVLKRGQRLADLYRRFPGALNIDLSEKPNIGDEELLEAMPLGFKNVRVLNMAFCFQITDAGLAPLTNLTSLDMQNCNQITDAGLAPLTNLTSLNMSNCRQITDAGVAPLINLTSLVMVDCNITDKCLEPLINLTSLNVGGCIRITDAGLAHLTNLTHLSIKYCKRITPAVFKNLNKLIYFDADKCSKGVEEAAHEKVRENMARKTVSTMEALNGGTRRRRSKKTKKSKKTRRN